MEESAKVNKREQGNVYEEKAALYMQGEGMCILKRNYRCRSGEIDIIARDGSYLVFTEVKYRRGGGPYEALEAVGSSKQRRISRAAVWYMTESRLPSETPVRFDVAAFDGEELCYLKNAFEYCR